MAQGKSQDRRMVRNRRVMIYTFLIILTLFYISAHRKLEREQGRFRQRMGKVRLEMIWVLEKGIGQMVILVWMEEVQMTGCI